MPDGHKFPLSKYGILRRTLEQEGLFDLEAAPPAAAEIIELTHDAEYVRNFLQGSLPPAAMRRIGFPWSDALVRRATASVGATLGAALDALQNGWGGTLGGGTHHAFRSEGAGFCVFNDIAVAIAFLRSRSLIRRAAVVDLDVHQGDGTAEIFRDDLDVFTLSIHCASNFPFRKQRSTLDLALADHASDDIYLRHLNECLPEVLAFPADIIFYQSGVDGLASDALGHLALTHEGLIERDLTVMRAARARGVPLVVTCGGGYSRPIELSALGHANTFRCALQVFSGSCG